MLIARGTPEPKEVEVEVNCDDPREAVIAFHGTYGFWPEEVVSDREEWTVVGGCESCGVGILEGDEYGHVHPSFAPGGAAASAVEASEDEVLLCGDCYYSRRHEAVEPAAPER